MGQAMTKSVVGSDEANFNLETDFLDFLSDIEEGENPVVQTAAVMSDTTPTTSYNNMCMSVECIKETHMPVFNNCVIHNINIMTNK